MELKKLIHGLIFAAAFVAATAASLSARAESEGFSDLIIFSGSLSDTGNLATLIGDFPPPYYNNRSSNGPVSVDIFAGILGFDAEPSLHLIGGEGGNNYAVKGATTGGTGPTDLPAQLDAYFARSGGMADPDALYLVFIGGHDVIQAVLEPDMNVSEQIIRDAVTGLKEGIKRLINAGAKKIYAPGFIDVGVAPAMRNAGLSDRASYLSALYERKFNRMLDRLERKTGIHFYRFSFWDFVQQSIDHHAVLGFTNATDSCVDSDYCDFDKFIFMDATFPSAKVHSLLGNALALDLLHQIATCKPGNWHEPSCRGPKKHW